MVNAIKAAIKAEEKRMNREAKEKKEEREMQEIYNSAFEPERDEHGWPLRF